MTKQASVALRRGAEWRVGEGDDSQAQLGTKQRGEERREEKEKRARGEGRRAAQSTPRLRVREPTRWAPGQRTVNPRVGQPGVERGEERRLWTPQEIPLWGGEEEDVE